MTDVLSVLTVFTVADMSQNFSDCIHFTCALLDVVYASRQLLAERAESNGLSVCLLRALCASQGQDKGLHEGTCSRAVVTGGPDALGQLRTESRNSPLRRCRKHPQF